MVSLGLGWGSTGGSDTVADGLGDGDAVGSVALGDADGEADGLVTGDAPALTGAVATMAIATGVTRPAAVTHFVAGSIYSRYRGVGSCLAARRSATRNSVDQSAGWAEDRMLRAAARQPRRDGLPLEPAGPG